MSNPFRINFASVGLSNEDIQEVRNEQKKAARRREAEKVSRDLDKVDVIIQAGKNRLKELKKRLELFKDSFKELESEEALKNPKAFMEVLKRSEMKYFRNQISAHLPIGAIGTMCVEADYDLLQELVVEETPAE